MAHPPQRTADLLARLLAAAPAEAAPALGTTSLEQFPLRGLIHSVAATALLALLLWGLVGLRRLASGWLAHLAQRRAEGLARRGIDFGPLIRAVVRTVVLGGFWVLVVGLVDAWLAFVLGRFEATAPWAEALNGRVLEVLAGVGLEVVRAIPGLVAVFVIVLLARGTTSFLAGVFGRVKGPLA